MSLDELLHNGKIEAHKTDTPEIKAKIDIADRNIRSADKIISLNDIDLDDTAYKEAYNAMLESSMALMYHKGYRVKQKSTQHWITYQFIKAEFSDVFDTNIHVNCFYSLLRFLV